MRLSLTKFCLIAFALAAVPVFAGPMPMAEKNVAPVAPACDWTGFYIGINAGVTELQSSFTDLADWESYATMSYQNTGFIGGGQVGYNYQWRDLVLGIEADFSGLTPENHVRAYPYEEPTEGGEDEGWQDKANVDFMVTLRGRVGVSFLDNKALLYVTAGGAYAHGEWDRYYHYYYASYAGYYEGEWKGDDWRWGWVGGFGFEYAFNCNWSLRAEGLYTWLEHDTQNEAVGPADAYVFYDHYIAPQRFEDTLWTYRVGLNYKFSGFFGAH